MNKVISPQLLILFVASAFAIYFLLNFGLTRVAARHKIKKLDWVIRTLMVIASLVGAAGISVAAVFLGVVPIGC